MFCFRVLTREANCVPGFAFFLFSGPPCCFKLARGSLRNLQSPVKVGRVVTWLILPVTLKRFNLVNSPV